MTQASISDWQSFVNGEARALTRAEPAAAQLFDLSGLGTLEIRGEQASSFLQGQLTNDIRSCTPERAQLSAWCSPKGRVLMSFWLVNGDEGAYRILSPTPLEPALVKRLQMYVLRAKVHIDTPSTFARVGCVGAEAQAALEAHLGAIPQRIGAVHHSDSGITVLRGFGAEPRFELIGETDAMRRAWEALGRVASLGPESAWVLGEVTAGVPLVYPDQSDEYLPQMLNLMELGAVSLEKGCYVGQEIVARAHYRGSVKRRLFRARCTAPSPPARGTEVLRTAGGEGRAVGKVLAAERAPGEVCELQVVLGIDAEGEALTLADGTALEPVSIDYLMERA